MDSTQTSFLSNINNWIPVLALLVSIIAIVISYKAIKKTEKISKPKLLGILNDNNRYIISLKDYSLNKNLRIDNVYFKPIDRLTYMNPGFSENRIPVEEQPVIELFITTKLVSGIGNNVGIVKIKTNFTTVYG